MHGPGPSTDDQAFRDLRASLTNQSPTEGQIARIERIRAAGVDAGHAIISQAPPSRERSLAITHLEEAVMWAVKSIVLPRESDHR